MQIETKRNKGKSCSQIHLQKLVDAYQKNKFQQVISEAKKLLTEHPECTNLLNIIGAAMTAVGHYETAIKHFMQAIKISPSYPDSYNNLGNLFLQNNDHKSAQKVFNTSIKLNPNYPIAYCNLGKSYLACNQPKMAIINFQNAIKLQPGYLDAMNNLGRAYIASSQFEKAIEIFKFVISKNTNNPAAHIGFGLALFYMNDLHAAQESFVKALELDSSNTEAFNFLLNLRKIYVGHPTRSNDIVNLDNEIRHDLACYTHASSKFEINSSLNKSFDKVRYLSKNLKLNQTQIFVRNTQDLNCMRHTQIFNEQNIISDFCFSCFKVQILVYSFIDLVRLSSLFYELDFEEELLRKTMVETRDYTAGQYKGFVYCRSIECAEKVSMILKGKTEGFLDNPKIQIKRGCSEFSLSYKKYGEVCRDTAQTMQYPKEWKLQESKFDQEYSFPISSAKIMSMREFSLSDLLIFEQWVDYAKGLGDPTVRFFDDKKIKHQEMFNAGLKRAGVNNGTN